MWTARGAYRTAEGTIVLLPERSALWTDKAALLKEVELSHPDMVMVPCASQRTDIDGEWLCWLDQEGVERFVVIEQA